MTEKGQRIAVVGSTDFPLNDTVGGQIVDLIRDLAPETILTRGTKGFDQFIIAIADILGIPWIEFKSVGGADNWDRDVRLVGQADMVLGFVSTTRYDEGKISGTQHVLEQGLNQKKPTRAYTAVNDNLIWTGELP